MGHLPRTKKTKNKTKHASSCAPAAGLTSVHVGVCISVCGTCVRCVGMKPPLINYREQKKICIEVEWIGEARH